MKKYYLCGPATLDSARIEEAKKRWELLYSQAQMYKRQTIAEKPLSDLLSDSWSLFILAGTEDRAGEDVDAAIDTILRYKDLVGQIANSWNTGDEELGYNWELCEIADVAGVLDILQIK